MVQNYFWSGATIVIYMHRTEVLDTCFNRAILVFQTTLQDCFSISNYTAQSARKLQCFSALFVSELQLEDSTYTCCEYNLMATSMTYDDLMNGSIYLVLIVERDWTCAVAAAQPSQGLLGQLLDFYFLHMQHCSFALLSLFCKTTRMQLKIDLLNIVLSDLCTMLRYGYMYQDY